MFFSFLNHLAVNLNPCRSIRTRLGWVLGATVFALCLCAGLIITTTSSIQLEANVGQSFAELAYQMSDKLDRGMFERYRDIQILSTLEPIHNPNAPLSQKRELLQKLQSTYSDYAWIGLTDQQGNVLVSTGKLLEGKNVNSRPWFKQAQNAPYVGDVHEAMLLSKLLPNPKGEPLRFVDLSIPIIDIQGNYQGVLGAHLSWKWAQEVKESLLPSLWQRRQVEMFILNQKGEILLAPTGYSLQKGGLASQPSVEAALKKQSSYLVENWSNGKAYITGFNHSQGYRDYQGLGWLILVRQPINIAFAPVWTLQHQIRLWSVAGGMLFSGIGWLIAGWIVNPILAIAAAADQIRRGNISVRLPVLKGKDEIAQLSQTLRQLISALTQQEKTLQKSEEQLRLALWAAQMGTWDWNVQTGEIIWSDNHERLFGLASGNFQGTYQAFAECVHPQDLDLVEQYLNRAKAQGTPYHQEFRVVWLDGSIHWITANGQFFYNEIGQAVRMTGTVMEVTERKTTEITLAQREQQYRTLVQNFPVGGVFLFDSDLRYILADGKGLAEVSLSKELMEGKTIWEILPPETTQIIEPIYRDALAGGTSTSEISFADRTYLLYALPVKNEQGEIMSGMLMSEDITDRKRAELALLQLKDELEIKVQERTADLTYANQHLQQEIIQRQQAQQELQESELLMRSLYQITASPRLALKERFQQLLAIGCRHFNLDFGFLTSIHGNEYKVISIQTPDNSVVPGDIFDTKSTYCGETIKREEPMYIPQASASEWRNHPGYTKFLMESYIGMKIMVNNAVYGTICFCSRIPTSRQFCSVDFELIKLISQWISSEMERSNAAARLEQLRHQNELILNSAGEGICGINLEGNITFVNPAAAKMLGYEVNELINQQICGLLFSCQEDKTVPNLTETFLNPVLKNGKLQHFRNQELWHKNGSSFPVECIATPMRERKTTNLDSLYQTTHAILDTFLPASSFISDAASEIVGVVVTFRDITERQAIEKMKDEFISVVSHELRTPLTAIRGSLGLLAAGLLINQPEKAKQMLEIAVANTDRLTRLINDILDIERIESGKIQMEKEACDAQELMVQTVEALRIIAQNAGITLSLGTINARVLVDRDRIIQVLTNLISNAIKFSPSNTSIEINAEWITETCSLSLLPDQELVHDQELDNKQPTLLFKVKDQGRGIPINKLESIFGRFQQVNASDSRDKGGTGLGLAICRSIVQQHHGCIWVQSQLDQGSTFYFTIPDIKYTKEASDQLLPSSPVASTPLVMLCDTEL